MNVKELRRLLPREDDDLEVLASPSVPGVDLDNPYFRVAGVRRSLEPDTAESIVVLDCDQSA